MFVTHYNIRFIALMTICSVLIMASGRVFADGPTHYKFGVFPFMPMLALIKYFNSVSIDFTRHLNKRVIAQSRPTFKDFTEEIEKETYDFVFVQPFDYPIAYKHNYRPLARRGGVLDAILISKTNSSIQSISDLAGKTLATPPKEAAISIIMRKELMDAGLGKQGIVKMIYTRNHFACIQMVLVNKADACSSTTPALYHWQTTRIKKKKLHVVHQADPMPPSLYMAHKRMPVNDQEKLKQAILSWDKRPEGRMILKIFSFPRFEEVDNAEYDVIRNYWDFMEPPQNSAEEYIK